MSDQQVYTDEQAAVRFTYVNWRGEVSERHVMPMGLTFGPTEWHPNPQWLLHAKDLDKGGAIRSFAVRDITGWNPSRPAEHTPPPDGPPAAATERKAGERWVEREEGPYWTVLGRAADGEIIHVAGRMSEADADLLAHGHARLRAMEAALRRYVEGDVCSCVAGGYGGDFPCEQCQGRDALGVADQVVKTHKEK